eukprot:TRINITY_DN1586_c0_g1_i1.p1 TRINITY_DN1586_c0_g1~~TRINITY_DN1586_c0_g1_i1.p1  ORF type:complete len:618 (+),score=149.08 TRINITY_DN1586_c0_g1_i1:141-1994(+)
MMMNIVDMFSGNAQVDFLRKLHEVKEEFDIRKAKELLGYCDRKFGFDEYLFETTDLNEKCAEYHWNNNEYNDWYQHIQVCIEKSKMIGDKEQLIDFNDLAGTNLLLIRKSDYAREYIDEVIKLQRSYDTQLLSHNLLKYIGYLERLRDYQYALELSDVLWDIQYGRGDDIDYMVLQRLIKVYLQFQEHEKAKLVCFHVITWLNAKLVGSSLSSGSSSSFKPLTTEEIDQPTLHLCYYRLAFMLNCIADIIINMIKLSKEEEEEEQEQEEEEVNNIMNQYKEYETACLNYNQIALTYLSQVDRNFILPNEDNYDLFPLLQYTRANLYLLLEQFDDAIECYREIEVFLINILNSYTEDNDDEVALEDEKANIINELIKLFSDVTEIYGILKNNKSMMKYHTNIITLGNPRDHEAYLPSCYKLIGYHLKNNNYNKVENIINNCIIFLNDPSNEDLKDNSSEYLCYFYIIYGKIKIISKDYQQAQRSLFNALRYNPDTSKKALIYQYLASNCFNDKKYELAKNNYQLWQKHTNDPKEFEEINKGIKKCENMIKRLKNKKPSSNIKPSSKPSGNDNNNKKLDNSGKKCSVCKDIKPKQDYSNSQFKLSATKRKCKSCILASQ